MDIKEFINDKFGSVRVIDNDGSEWFVGVDVARCLGYKDPRSAIKDHIKKKHKKEIIFGVGVSPTPKTRGGLRNVMVIDFPGLCKLVMHSKLPDAEEFQDWICEEVLPSIRESGMYLDPDQDLTRSLTLETRTELTDLFDILRTHCYWMTPGQAEYCIRALSGIANRLAGIPKGKRDDATSIQLIKLNIIEASFSKTIVKCLKKYLTTREKFTFSTLTDKCEAKAINALINAGYEIKNTFIIVK